MRNAYNLFVDDIWQAVQPSFTDELHEIRSFSDRRNPMTRQTRQFANIVAWLFAIGGIAGCAPEKTTEQIVKSGESVFTENCSTCHGPDGRGPALKELLELSPEGLRKGIQNHPTAGQIPQRLPAVQIGDLIEYIEAQDP
jgi:mono/diheme cytochrome c family protein